MILTCPDCATSYFVDDDRVPAQGRTVKCSSCGNRWHATPEGAAEPVITPPRKPVQIEDPGEPIVRSPPMVDDLEIIAPLSEREAKAREKPAKTGKSRVGLIIAVAIAAAVVAGIGAAVVFRQQIVELVPASVPVFSAVGLKVDTLGLVIENVTSKAVMQGGRPVLSITGVIHNKNETASEAPPIRISLLNEEGVPVAGLLAQPLNAGIPPGARRYFAVSLPDPPASARELEIAFDLTAKAPATHAVAADPAPETVDAKPLPANSPDAISPHEPH